MISGKKVSLVLQKRTRSTDSRGGYVDTWTESETFKGVLSPKLNTEGLKYAKETIEGSHILYCKPPTNAITNFDRITYEGRVFDVKAVQSPMMSTKVLKIGLMELK